MSATQPTQTFQAPRPARSQEVGIGTMIADTAIETMLVVNSSARNVRKTLGLVELQLDKLTMESVFELRDLIVDNTGNDTTFLNNYFETRKDCRVRGF